MSQAPVRKALRVLVDKHGVRGAAKRTKLSAATISRVLSGQRQPGARVLKALGFTISYTKNK